MAKKYTEADAILYMEAKNLKPLEPFINVTSKWKYQCKKCGNKGITSLHAVKNGGNGCPYCSGNKPDPIKMEQRLKEEGLEPLEPYKSNSTKWKMFHRNCAQEVFVTWADIQSGGGGCGFCRYKKIAKKLKRDEDFAIAKMIEAGGEPLEPYLNGNARWKVRCLKCDRISTPTFNNVIRGQGVCLACRPKPPVTTKDEAMAFIAFKKMKAISTYVSAHSKWKLQCEICSKVDDYVFTQMKAKNYGCVYCSNHKVDPIDVKIAFESLGFLMLEDYKNAREPIKSECQSCKKISPKRYDDVRVGKGCKYCQKSAIDLTAKTYFYLIKHDVLNAVKVGIGNVGRKQDRLQQHKNHGWLVLYKYIFNTGETAYLIEQEMLKWLKKDKNLPSFLGKSEMPQGGWTETFSADEISLFELKIKFENLLTEITSVK